MDSLVEWSRVLSLALVPIQALLLWVLWSLRKQFVSRDHCAKQSQLMDKRQTVLETAQDAMPTSRDVEAIKDRLGGIEGEIKALLAMFRGQTDLMARLERPLNLLMEHHLRENQK